MKTGDLVVDEVLEAVRLEIQNFMFGVFFEKLKGVERVLIEVTNEAFALSQYDIFVEGVHQGKTCSVCRHRLHCITSEIPKCERPDQMNLRYDLNREIKTKNNLRSVNPIVMKEIANRLGFVQDQGFTCFWKKGKYEIWI